MQRIDPEELRLAALQYFTVTLDKKYPAGLVETMNYIDLNPESLQALNAFEREIIQLGKQSLAEIKQMLEKLKSKESCNDIDLLQKDLLILYESFLEMGLHLYTKINKEELGKLEKFLTREQLQKAERDLDMVMLLPGGMNRVVELVRKGMKYIRDNPSEMLDIMRKPEKITNDSAIIEAMFKSIITKVKAWSETHRHDLTAGGTTFAFGGAGSHSTQTDSLTKQDAPRP